MPSQEWIDARWKSQPAPCSWPGNPCHQQSQRETRWLCEHHATQAENAAAANKCAICDSNHLTRGMCAAHASAFYVLRKHRYSRSSRYGQLTDRQFDIFELLALTGEATVQELTPRLSPEAGAGVARQLWACQRLGWVVDDGAREHSRKVWKLTPEGQDLLKAAYAYIDAISLTTPGHTSTTAGDSQ